MAGTDTLSSGSLQNLNDIVVPGAVAWWPPAPGWYVLAGVLAVVLAYVLLRRWQRWQRDRYRRLALEELAAIKKEGPVAAMALPALLKRTALSAWPREDVAALTGPDWHRFLDKSAGMNQFCSGAGSHLDCLAYGDADRVASEMSGPDFAQLLDATQSWLKNHQAPAGER